MSLAPSLRGRLAPVRVQLLVLLLTLLLASCGYDHRHREAPVSEDVPRTRVQACSEPLEYCGEECVDLDYEPSHCGACDISCAKGEHCWEGRCTGACIAPLAACGDSCVDTQHDPAHCGGCNQACDEQSFCSSGECSNVCPAGAVACGGSCVFPRNSRTHCGARFECTGEDAGAECSEQEACFLGHCVDSFEEFVTVWSIRDIEEWNEITLPLVESGSYGFVVDWGDSTVSEITAWDSPEKTHRYAEPGDYTVRILGTISGWQFYTGSETAFDKRIADDSTVREFSGDAEQLLEIRNWGPLALGNTMGQFLGTRRLVISATDAPDLTETTSLRGAFAAGFMDLYALFARGETLSDDNRSLYASLAGWDTSPITDMSYLFYEVHLLRDADIGSWDTSKVTDMSYIFHRALSYVGDIADWDTSRVTSMKGAFHSARWGHKGAAPPIGNWDVSNVRNMGVMFMFSSPPTSISDWDTSRVTNMAGMFYGSSAGADIGGWDTSKVTNMAHMFFQSEFSQDISEWDTSEVTNMQSMFVDADAFNQDLGDWNTSKVTKMNSMFSRNGVFNQDLGDWDTSQVVDMEKMFDRATAFNSDIGDWDTSRVTNMKSMFAGAESFNQDLGTWDTSQVTSMELMFRSRLTADA